MNNKIIIAVIVGVVILGGGYAVARQASNNKNASQQDSKAMMQDVKLKENENLTMEKNATDTAPQSGTNEDKMMKKTEDSMTEDNKKIMQQKLGVYEDYSPTALAEATKNGGKAVLFFWASWCPYCKEANADFMANTVNIPAGITVLKTNYDTEKDLKTKYGVTYQHTFVQVGSNGNQLTKWSGGGVKELIANIK